MQQIITAKPKLIATPEQGQLLRHSQLTHRDALNYVSRCTFEHGKLSSDTRLQKETYRLVYRNEVILLCQEPHA